MINVKLLWDFNIRTDRVIEARRPDIVLINKKNKEVFVVDVANHGDFRVKDKELEKMEKYQDLVIEVQRMWDTEAKVIPIVIGALGAENNLTDYLALLRVQTRKTNSMLQAALLGLAHILRKVLSIPA